MSKVFFMGNPKMAPYYDDVLKSNPNILRCIQFNTTIDQLHCTDYWKWRPWQPFLYGFGPVRLEQFHLLKLNVTQKACKTQQHLSSCPLFKPTQWKRRPRLIGSGSGEFWCQSSQVPQPTCCWNLKFIAVGEHDLSCFKDILLMCILGGNISYITHDIK